MTHAFRTASSSGFHGMRSTGIAIALLLSEQSIASLRTKHCFPLRKALLCQTESNAPDTGVIYIIRIQPQKSQRLICSFVHKGSILTVFLLNYSSTSIGLLQYSYWITPVLLLDYSSTSIRIHKSTDSCFPAKPISSSTCQLVSSSTSDNIYY